MLHCSVAHLQLTVLVLVSSVTGVALAQSPRGPPARSERDSFATVVFGGDVLPHASVVASVEAYGADSLLDGISDVLREADISLLTIDSPVTPSQPSPAPGTRFNTPSSVVDALARAGIDGIAVANNHAHDAGARGLGETLDTIEQRGIRAIGGARAGGNPMLPTIFDVHGRSLCVFAATRFVNHALPGTLASRARVAIARYGRPHEEQALVDAIRAARPTCGAIFVMLHMGREYSGRPLESDRVFCRALAAAGADAIVGDHPHVVQPMQVFNVRHRAVPVYYSLGNLVSGQGSRAELDRDPSAGTYWRRSLDARVREGVLAVIEIEPTGARGLSVRRFGWTPVWTRNSTLDSTVRPVRIAAAFLPAAETRGDRFAVRRAVLLRTLGPSRLRPPAGLRTAAR